MPFFFFLPFKTHKHEGTCNVFFFSFGTHVSQFGLFCLGRIVHHALLLFSFLNQLYCKQFSLPKQVRNQRFVMENLSNFEMLPDEMILYVCQYLRNAEILYSFFNLNTRLNSTITDYYRRVNLKNVTYKQFNFVTMKIIPEIGSFIESFVFNGPWESIMFKSPNSIFSKAKLSSIFPQLRRMSIVGFIDQQLNEFLEKITDFPHLVKLDIRSAQVDGQEDSLKKLLAANSNRLKSIMFDYDSMDFVLESNKNEETISFTNIEELALNLKTDKIFGSLFMLVPNVTRLYIDFDETSSTSTTIITNIPSLIYLKDFRLRSLDTDWSLNEISFILNKMPSLQRLALDLPTTDYNLINGNNFLKVLPLSLVEIHFFIIYKHLMSPQEIDNLVSTWPNYPQIACLEYKSADYMVIHTMPCDFISINIPASVAKKMFVGSNYTRKVRDLKIFGDQNSTDIHSILQHFQRIRTLTIGSKNQQKESMYFKGKKVY